jgi:hypothetical protein
MERPLTRTTALDGLARIALGISFVAALAGSARAQDIAPATDGGGVLQTPQGPLALQLGLGGAFGITGNGYAQFKLAAEGVYHFDGGTGPAVGAAIHASFVDFVALQFLGRFQWDIEIVDGVLVTPFAHLGAAVLLSPLDTAAFDIGIGAEAKIAFGQFYVWVRPLYLDIFIQSEVGLRWDVLAGGGFTL